MRSSISKRNIMLVLLCFAISFQVAHSVQQFNVSEYIMNAVNAKRANKGAKNMKEVHQDGHDYNDDPIPGEVKAQAQFTNSSINTNGGGYYYEVSTGYAYIRYQIPGADKSYASDADYQEMIDGIESAVTYTYSTKQCATGNDANKCKQFLTLNWYSVEAIYCTDSGKGILYTPNLASTFIVCAFKNAPHPTTEINTLDPWLTGTACSDCPSNYNKCRGNLCSNIFVDPDTGVTDKFLYCQYKVSLNYDCQQFPGTFIFNNGCPATCGNKDLLQCFDSTQGNICALTLQNINAGSCNTWKYTCPLLCSLCKVKTNTITSTDRTELTNLINFYRGAYDKKAEAMRNVSWDNDLEKVALRIASDCLTSNISDAATYRTNKYGNTGVLSEMLFNKTQTTTQINAAQSFRDAMEDQIQYSMTYVTFNQQCLAGKCNLARDYVAMTYAPTTKFACARYLCDSATNRWCYSCVFSVGNNNFPATPNYVLLSETRPNCGTCPSGTICSGNLCVNGLTKHFPSKNGTTCTDQLSSCPTWAWVDGLCYQYPGYYTEVCPKSCNVCPGDSLSNDWCETIPPKVDVIFNCAELDRMYAGDCTETWYFSLCPAYCASENFHKCKN